MNQDNKEKAESGNNNKEELNKVLKEVEDNFNNVEICKGKSYGFPGKNAKQFKVNAEIIFKDNDQKDKETWIIKSSSSYRSDRVKGNEFDVEHIKSLKKESNLKAFFVIPDNQSAKDLKQFNKYKNDVRNGKIITYFDYILKLSEFQNALRKRSSQYLTQGVRSNILGNGEELAISDAFNNPNNVILWNQHGNNVVKSRNYFIVKAFMEKFFPNSKIKSMNAYNNSKKDIHYMEQLNIVKNPQNNKNMGKPKTDVLIDLTLLDGSKHKIKMSIKHPATSKKHRISVHEGSVERLLDDLEKSIPENSSFYNNSKKFSQLKKALLNFQRAGAVSKMEEKYRSFLNKNFYELNSWLIDYCLFGINNHMFNDNQIVNVLEITNPSNGQLNFLSAEEEKKRLLEYCKERKASPASFGTPFTWTYPSKKRTKKIQVNLPTILY